LGGVCRLFPKTYDALAIVRPGDPLASSRFQIVLALEIVAPLRSISLPLENRRLVAR
jgi:hypothetical protein